MTHVQAGHSGGAILAKGSNRGKTVRFLVMCGKASPWEMGKVWGVAHQDGSVKTMGTGNDHRPICPRRGF